MRAEQVRFEYLSRVSRFFRYEERPSSLVDPLPAFCTAGFGCPQAFVSTAEDLGGFALELPSPLLLAHPLSGGIRARASLRSQSVNQPANQPTKQRAGHVFGIESFNIQRRWFSFPVFLFSLLRLILSLLFQLLLTRIMLAGTRRQSPRPP